MKILYAVPEGVDMGGIITSSEHLMAGFAEAGYRATFALIRPTTTRGGTLRAKPKPGTSIGVGTGRTIHPRYGWQDGEYFSFGSRESINDFVALAKRHDAVVWAAAYGLVNKCTLKNTDWVRVFSETGRPNVMMVRDDHLPERYPWVLALENWITAWACVQTSSYDSCAGTRRPRAVVYSGHDTDAMPGRVRPWERRPRSFFMMHTFKAWKNAHVLIAAAPYLDGRIHLAGAGIEYHYMSSLTKCKPRYICTEKNDPDAHGARLGKPLWQNALAERMKYHGAISPEDRDIILARTKLFVDLSWRPESTGQINRTVVEAIAQGCIPVCYPRFITGNDQGRGRLFRAYQHFLPVPHGVTPKALAETLNGYLQLGDATCARMQHAGRTLIRGFGRATAAQALAELAQGKPAGAGYAPGGRDQELRKRGRRMFRSLFGRLP